MNSTLFYNKGPRLASRAGWDMDGKFYFKFKTQIWTSYFCVLIPYYGELHHFWQLYPI